MLTFLLSIAGCVLLFFGIWSVTVTMPTKLLTKTRFFQHYFPETEGCAGWQDFGYNRKQQLRHIIMIPIGCVVMALIFTRLD